MERTAFGRQGESLARTYLEQKGFTFIGKNFKRLHGEIDLIMKDGPALVFVEVKTRTTLRWGAPAEAVTSAKQRHLRWCAEVYCAEHHLTDTPLRFDVVEILALPGRPVRFHHISNAF